jgi:hypothetical protein
MHYLDFLRSTHELLRPRTYLEIGVRSGDSLALSRSPSIGIDPAFAVKEEIDCDVALFKTTSDEYFSRPAPLAPLDGRPVDLAFIDGMHLFEYALRDFINVERHTDWTSVVVFDDMLPRSNDEAARDRHTRAWTGDVYKVIPVLQEHRPDLLVVRVNTKPTGLLLIAGTDPSNTTLHDRYDDIVAQWATADPQQVPGDILEREGAVDPQRLLASPLWSQLRSLRESRTSRRRGVKKVSESFARLPRHGQKNRSAASRPLPVRVARAAARKVLR